MSLRAILANTHPDRMLRTVVVLTWVLLAIAGFSLIDHYNTEEKIRTLRMWEQRLALAADAQSKAVSTEIATRTKVLTTMAENVSLRLYLTTLENTKPEEAEAEQAFLRNYLFASAEQAGLAPKESEAAAIPANLLITPDRGLALLSKTGKPYIATRHFPASIPDDLLQRDPQDAFNLVGPRDDGKLWISVPIYAVQEDATSEPIGWVVGTFAITELFDEILAKGELPDSPATSLLIHSDGEVLSVIAPKAQREQVLRSTQYTTLAARAHAEHNTLLSGRDGNRRAAFAYAAPVTQTDWSLVREVTRKAALAETEKRAARLLMLFGLAVATITLTVVALWRHVTAERLRHLLQRIQHHERLLALITEHIPARLFIVDAHARYRYANHEAASAAHTTKEEVLGKTLTQALGAAAAKSYTDINLRVLNRGISETVLHEKMNGGELESASRVQHVPLEDIPETYASGGQAVLIIEEDLTEVMRAKHAHQQTLRTLIDTVITIADTRDPYAAHHSAGVAHIARAIAETMRLDSELVNTASIAGQLMNLGKVFIPQDLLLSQKPIDPSDKQLIAQSLAMAIEHLSHVPFEGPVIETLRQTQERPDGSGPLKLEDHATLVTARIVAVANSFVALTSARAYRKSLTIAEAISVLQKASGISYSPAVVAALSHYMGNLGGTAEWQAFLESTTR